MVNNLYKFYDKWLIPVVFAFLVLVYPSTANALADSLGFARAYQISCDVTPIRMCNSGYCQFQAFKFSTAGSIFLGGSDVNTTTKGFPYVNGDKDSIDGSPGAFFCTAAAPVTVTILAGRK
jgi:hypothetical protein